MTDTTNPLREIREALEAFSRVTNYAEAQICTHDEIDRAGFLWSICRQCGGRWADDQGGVPVFKLPEAIERAYVGIAKARAALTRLSELEAAGAEPVAWRYRFHTDASLEGKPNVRPWITSTTEVPSHTDIEVEPLYTHPAASPHVQELRMLTEAEVLASIFANSGHHGNGPDLYKTLVTESGPYSINRLTVFGAMLTEALQARFCEVNGLAAPKEPTPNSGADGVPPTDQTQQEKP